MTTTNWIILAAIAAVLTLPPPVTAQDDVLIPAKNVEHRLEFQNSPVLATFDVTVNLADEETKKESDDDQASAGEYWLGIQVAAVPEIARRQLAIDHGLGVEDVSPDSPAAKADIKKFDILTEAGDTKLKGVGDLIKSVEAAKGKQIVITLKRDGQSRKVEVTAEKRPKAEVAVEIVRKKVAAQKDELAAATRQLEEALEKMKGMKGEGGKDGFGMWFAKPAIVAPRLDVRLKEQMIKDLKADFPKDVSVQINKQGAEPTKIRVKRGDQEWEVTDDKLGDLPEDIRIHVQKLLGQMKGPAIAANAQHIIRVTPEGKVEGELRIPPMPPKPPVPAIAPVAPAAPRAPTAQEAFKGWIEGKAPPAKSATSRSITARVERNDDGTDAKLDAIIKKLDKLEKEIDKLRDKK
jgi:hypothetical protein